jgi:hypothetical protein
MGKYDPLRDRLKAAPDEIEWTFGEVSDLVGGLPASARDHPAWGGTSTRMSSPLPGCPRDTGWSPLTSSTDASASDEQRRDPDGAAPFEAAMSTVRAR